MHHGDDKNLLCLISHAAHQKRFINLQITQLLSICHHFVRLQGVIRIVNSYEECILQKLIENTTQKQSLVGRAKKLCLRLVKHLLSIKYTKILFYITTGTSIFLNW